MRKYLDAYVTHETKNMTKEEWLRARGAGIGGSDASSVLGFSPYRSSISVYLEKVHYVNLAKGLEDKDIYESLDAVNEGSYKMELSKKLEDFVAREFSLITGKKVRNVNGILKNDKYPFALANINKAVVGEKAFLQCKVTNSFNKKEWSKTVPIHYQIQMNHYMAVTGASHCYVAALIGNEELVIHKLERDKEMIDEIKKICEQIINNNITPNYVDYNLIKTQIRLSIVALLFVIF